VTQELVAGQTHRVRSASAPIETAATTSGGSALAGAELALFLLFPSLGIIQKYLGTGGAFAYFGIGGLLLIALSARARSLASEIKGIGRPWIRLAIAVTFGALAMAFVLFYASAGNGNDRGDSLNVGIHELLAGRYPYYQTTRFQNVVTQMPGSLLLAAPFALLGDAAWQNLFWLGALFVVIRALLGDDHRALALMALILVGSPAVLHDFVTGGDLGASTIALLIGMLALVALVPDPSAATWKKVAAAAFTGLALSSRMNYLLLMPPLIAALLRRASIADALRYLCVTAAAFAAVTLPFYWHDPIEFAPIHLHNKFAMFGEVPSGWILFPAISLLAGVLISTHPANRTVRGWLIQSAIVMTIPVVILVGLATYRVRRPDFVFADYAVASVIPGVIGIAVKGQTEK
jgi:ALG3 protein